MRIRREINLLTSLLSAATGVEAVTPYRVIIAAGTFQQEGTLLGYFEIVTRSSASIAYTVLLKSNSNTVTRATINVPAGTTAYTRFRSTDIVSGGGLSGNSDFQVTVGNASGATKEVIAARVVVLQPNPFSSVDLIEIGSTDLAKINTVSAPLIGSICWLYTAANHDGVLSFEASVTYLTATTKNTCTITLQEDDGSFGGWTDIATLVNAVSILTITRAAVAFTPVDGRHYRIASLGSTSKSSYSIYAATIQVIQNPVASDLDGDDTGYSSDPNLVAYYKLEDATDSFGSNDLTVNSGSVSYVAAKFGSGADFGSTDGHFNRLRIAHDFGIDIDTQSLSYSLWVKFNAAIAGSGYTFIQIINADGKRCGIRYNGTSTRFEAQIGGSPFPYTVPGDWDDGNWHHVVFSATGGANNGYFYVDGVQRSSVLSYSTFGTGAAGVEFTLGAGGSASGSAGQPVVLDDVMIFNRNLSSVDVRKLYYAQLKKFECQYLLANKTFAAGTSLQDYDTLYDPAEWIVTGYSSDFYHEVNSVAGGTSDIKLQNTSGPTDVTDSTVTDAIERSRSAVMTMPVSAATIDCIATSNAGNIHASKIIVVTKIIIIESPSYVGGTEMMHLGVGVL